jgi:hypothetical protein
VDRYEVLPAEQGAVVRRELVEFTLRDIAQRVTALVPVAATLHLAVRYPDEAGVPDRWQVRHLSDAAGRPITPAAAVESELEDALHEPLADLADLADVTDSGRIPDRRPADPDRR